MKLLVNLSSCLKIVATKTREIRIVLISGKRRLLEREVRFDAKRFQNCRNHECTFFCMAATSKKVCARRTHGTRERKNFNCSSAGKLFFFTARERRVVNHRNQPEGLLMCAVFVATANLVLWTTSEKSSSTKNA